ncbi:hypothetical protein ABB02_01475 [Clostridiaceae bacterium JG1575]|nr:hypothetical protein ABB02_01475 [Clostridiaceae bacterium JG1575]
MKSRLKKLSIPTLVGLSTLAFVCLVLPPMIMLFIGFVTNMDKSDIDVLLSSARLIGVAMMAGYLTLFVVLWFFFLDKGDRKALFTSGEPILRPFPLIFLPLTGGFMFSYILSPWRTVVPERYDFLSSGGISLEAWQISELTFSALLIMIAINILAPLIEELFFRGMLLQGFAKEMTFWKSAVISSLIYGIMHFEGTSNLFALAGMGFLLALVFHLSRSLWVTIAAHAINSFFTIILNLTVLARWLSLRDALKVQLMGGILLIPLLGWLVYELLHHHISLNEVPLPIYEHAPKGEARVYRASEDPELQQEQEPKE